MARSKADFYLALLDDFFNDDGLHFRGVVIDKGVLDHESELMQLADLIIGALAYHNRIQWGGPGEPVGGGEPGEACAGEPPQGTVGEEPRKINLDACVEAQPLEVAAGRGMVGGRPRCRTDLLRLPNYGGDWLRYIEEIYRVFRRDFIESQPRFHGRWVRCRRDIQHDQKEAGFWHCVQAGETEEQRTLDLRRCERISWVRAVIENEQDARVETWPTRRGERQADVPLVCKRVSGGARRKREILAADHRLPDGPGSYKTQA